MKKLPKPNGHPAGGPGQLAGQRLSFKGMGQAFAARMLPDSVGMRALAPSGAAVVAQGFTGDPVPLGRRRSRCWMFCP